jgi:hypothetical protein
MKPNKAVKRLTHVEELISDVVDRYSAGSPDIRENLQDAKAAVTRARDAVSLEAPSKTKRARKKAANSKEAVRVPPVKTTKKERTTKRNYEE